jgi:hypothetical protein
MQVPGLAGSSCLYLGPEVGWRPVFGRELFSDCSRRFASIFRPVAREARSWAETLEGWRDAFETLKPLLFEPIGVARGLPHPDARLLKAINVVPGSGTGSDSETLAHDAARGALRNCPAHPLAHRGAQSVTHEGVAARLVIGADLPDIGAAPDAA